LTVSQKIASIVSTSLCAALMDSNGFALTMDGRNSRGNIEIYGLCHCVNQNSHRDILAD